MRILVLVARYPPHHEAAAERRCADVARELARRGHSVRVVTSRAEGEPTRGEEHGVTVVRELGIGDDATRGLLTVARDCRVLRTELADIDVVLFCHSVRLSLAAIWTVHALGLPAIFDVASDWLLDMGAPSHPWIARWRPPASGLARSWRGMRGSCAALLKVPITPVMLPFGRSYFWSRERWKRYLAAGLRVQDATLVEPGVDVRLFAYRPKPFPTDSVRVLFTGRIAFGSGLHSMVLALSDLPERVRLRISGVPEDEGYLAEVGELGRAAGTLGRIEVMPATPPSKLPELLAAADVVVYPVESPERFPRRALQAFAVGTPVVGTAEGEAAARALREGETALTFTPGNARELGHQMGRLLSETGLRERLVERARKLVEAEFALGFSVDQIEPLLSAAGESDGEKA